jgi:ADP-ribosyl-[dinitrogen reductase] hydrolase
MDRPIENSYWVVPGRLLAGEHPYDGDESDALQRLQRLLDAGIDSFLDLTHSGERPEYQRYLPQDVQVLRSAIRDCSVPTDIAEMREIQAHLHTSLAAGRRVYVHCRAGIGRTGIVIGCFLAEQGMDGASALTELNRLWRQSKRSSNWPEVPQTLEQADFIRHWPRHRRAQAEAPEESAERDRRERFVGCLLGLAVGDALSVATHYQRPAQFEPISEMTGGGVFGLPRGHWTDDTALSLCMAESLLECKGFQVSDQLQRFGRWQHQGYLAAGRHCAGITPGTARALYRSVKNAPKPAFVQGVANDEPAPLSRTAPVVMFHYRAAIEAVSFAEKAAQPFEAASPVRDAVRLLAAMLLSALRGEPLARVLQPSPHRFGPTALPDSLESLLARDPTLPPSEGVDPALFVLAAARWALSTSGSFRAGALRAANIGGDSDVIGAVHGQLAGAFYGHASIPNAWLRTLAKGALIESLAERLFAAGPSQVA